MSRKKRKREWCDWFGAGYLDARDRTPYARAPEPGQEPPSVPDDDLPPEWWYYLDGFRAGINDMAAETTGQRIPFRIEFAFGSAAEAEAK